MSMQGIFLCVLALWQVAGASMIISTYNLWNVMFNWEVRQQRIAEMIKQIRPNIIALQEVRCGENYIEKNQVLDLKRLLPSEYKWHVFRKASNVTLHKESMHTQWNGEGLGLISNLPIIDSSVKVLLPSSAAVDTNLRILLHVSVQMPDGGTINIIVVHLSYQRQQQCKNAAEILGYLTAKQVRNTVILGDFNTYNEFDWPIMMLSHPHSSSNSPCKADLTSVFKHGLTFSSLETFFDAWLISQDMDDGYTFSNMPTPGYESRPDRILVNTGLEVTDMSLNGDGSRYKRRYTAAVHWERFITVLNSAYLSYQGRSGYPCLQDCGPHGSCQCGVCVKGDNQHHCNLPDCKACDQHVFMSLVSVSALCFLVFVYLCFVVVLILVVGAGSYGSTMYSILGFNCCLCNPKLLKHRNTFTQSYRKCRLLRIFNVWLFRLPPYVQLVIGVVSSLMVYYYSSIVLRPAFDATYAVMEEEFYPSDHLMLTAHLEMKH